MLALGLAAALRRSELVALQLADLALVEQGLTLRIRQSKTDQDGMGAVIAIPAGKVLIPVKHLNAWVRLRGGELGRCSSASHRTRSGQCGGAFVAGGLSH